MAQAQFQSQVYVENRDMGLYSDLCMLAVSLHHTLVQGFLNYFVLFTPCRKNEV